MPHVTLVHWHAGEAEERIQHLADFGCEATLFGLDSGPAALRRTRADPPDAFVIDLTRLPSHGRAVATALRQQKVTRHIPLVFVAGDSEKVARIRALLPDATYTTWPRIGAALERAISSAPREPLVPGMMAGYAKTPLPKKLGVHPGMTVMLLGAPDGFEAAALAGVPDVDVRRAARGTADLVMLFVRSRAALLRRLPAAQRCTRGGLWIAWRKKAAGVRADISERDVRQIGLAAGLVDHKICAIDATWSGLRFARRK